MEIYFPTKKFGHRKKQQKSEIINERQARRNGSDGEAGI